MIVLLVILLAAALTDYKRGKIPNWMIVFGIMSGLFYSFYGSGFLYLPDNLLGVVLPVVLLFPAFAIGGLGAGDLKLFAVVGSYMGVQGVLISLCFAFVIGAVFSFIKMLRYHNFKERIFYFFSYLSDIFLKGKWQLYEALEPDVFHGREPIHFPKHKIHFAPAIFLGVLAYMGGSL